MKDYSFYIECAWGFAVLVLTLMFVLSWRGLHNQEKKHAEKA